MWNRQRLSESRAAAALVDGTRRLPYLLTSLAAGLAIAVVLAAVVADVQVLEVPLAALDRIERHETGAIATVILLMIAAFITDHTVAGQRTQRETHLQNQRLRIEQVQIRTVQTSSMLASTNCSSFVSRRRITFLTSRWRCSMPPFKKRPQS